MSHIIILDENGNEIGRSEPGDEPTGGNFAAQATPEIHIRMNLSRVKDLIDGKEPDKKHPNAG